MNNALLTVWCAMGRLYAQEMSPVLAQFGLTGVELDVLLFLGNNPAFDTASDVVRIRQLTKSHVSKAVDGLTERGLLTRRRDERNRRRVHLAPTEAARPILAAGRARQRDFVAMLTDGLTPEDDAALRRLADRIAANARRALGEP